jgi:hypothetical protein
MQNFCDSCNHAACNVGREFDAAVLHYKRGLEKSKKIVEDFHKELEVIIASRPQEAGQILAAISAFLQEATGNAAYDKSRDPRQKIPQTHNPFSMHVGTHQHANQ